MAGTGVPGVRGSVVNPTTDDPLIGVVSDVVGGRVGRHRAAPVVEAWQRRAIAICMVLASVSMVLAVGVRNHCRESLWKAPDQFTHLCYSDIPAVFSAGKLAEGLPYVDGSPGSLAQPVGSGLLLWALGLITPGGDTELRWVFDAASLLILVCLLVTLVAVGLLAGRRAWDAALVAASPVIVFSALISLDLAAVALAAVGLLAFARGRVAWAGVLVGLGIAVRPIEIVIVVAVVIVGFRRAQLAPVGSFLAATVVGWMVLNLPLAVLGPQGWTAYWRTLWAAELSYGSVWLIPQVLHSELTGQEIPEPSLALGIVGVVLVLSYAIVLAFAGPDNRRAWLPVRPVTAVAVGVIVAVLPFAALAAVGSLLPQVAQPLPAGTGRWIAMIGFPVVAIVVVWVARQAPVPPRVPAVALMLIVGWMAVAPSVPVQAGVWLLPLIALTVPSWRLMALFSFAEVSYGVITWLYLYGLSVDNRGAPAWVYVVALLFRFGVWLWVGWQAWSVSWWPEDDLVRRDLGDDPTAGPMVVRPTAGYPVDSSIVPTPGPSCASPLA